MTKRELVESPAARKNDAARNLWAAVLERAIEDMVKVNAWEYAEDAKRWLRDTRETPGSFIFICNVLVLGVKSTRRAIEAYVGVKNG